MSAKEIQRVIGRYTAGKFMISILLIMEIMCFLIGVLVIRSNMFSIIIYFLLLLTAIAGYIYPARKPLSKKPMIQDYEGILDYLANISDETGRQKYYDGMVMIKKTLNCIVYYQISEQKEYLKSSICYLQGKFFSMDRKKYIPEEWFDRAYVRNICTELQMQLRDHTFNSVKLEEIRSKGNQKISRKWHMSFQLIKNIPLVILVVYKIIVTVNPACYEKMNENIIMRLAYNIGSDVLPIFAALQICLKKTESLSDHMQ